MDRDKFAQFAQLAMGVAGVFQAAFGGRPMSWFLPVVWALAGVILIAKFIWDLDWPKWGRALSCIGVGVLTAYIVYWQEFATNITIQAERDFISHSSNEGSYFGQEYGRL